MSLPPYRLSISIEYPKIATEGEEFTLTYKVKNIDNNPFPGGDLNVIMSWPAIGSTMLVGHPLSVDLLARIKCGHHMRLEKLQ
jgi:hypothetical protein